MPLYCLRGVPNARQREFFYCTARHIAYGGARGGGKSWAMRRKFVLLALRYPQLQLLLLRRTLPELQENHGRPLQRELLGIANYNGQSRSFLFPNGSRIRLGYCEKETDVYRYQGQEYDVIGLEEATHFTESQMLFLATCNRTVRTDFSPRMYYTCNPGGVGHAWVKRLFIDRRYQNGEHAKDYAFVPARVYDNHVLCKADPGYIATLANLPEHLRRAHLEGDWDALEGQYFSEFRREKHVCAPFSIPGWWRRFRAMDWGYNDPCAVLWFACGPDGRVYVYREEYERQVLSSHMAARIRAASLGEKIAYTVASPDAWQKRGISARPESVEGESIADVFARGGVPLLRADNARVAGWQRVREYLADAPDGMPRLQIFHTCENLIRTLPLLQHSRVDGEDAADGEDHAPEALRYGLMSRPARSSPPEAAQLPAYNPLAGEVSHSSGFLNV
ncbi:phage terminase large subunit [Christensenellaceae bacterium OttesenSCG-928-L17]|nr:phage terminase large subunit [Christensenellaceae bacterium OttesenSCG-928-L17]